MLAQYGGPNSTLMLTLTLTLAVYGGWISWFLRIFSLHTHTEFHTEFHRRANIGFSHEVQRNTRATRTTAAQQQQLTEKKKKNVGKSRRVHDVMIDYSPHRSCIETHPRVPPYIPSPWPAVRGRNLVVSRGKCGLSTDGSCETEPKT